MHGVQAITGGILPGGGMDASTGTPATTETETAHRPDTVAHTFDRPEWKRHGAAHPTERG
jgi:hypothetical protein